MRWAISDLFYRLNAESLKKNYLYSILSLEAQQFPFKILGYFSAAGHNQKEKGVEVIVQPGLNLCRNIYIEAGGTKKCKW
jgi:hypothetical protein